MSTRHEYKINNFKILARSNILEEQYLKASFVVNICDKDQAEKFVKSEWIQLPTTQKGKQ